MEYRSDENIVVAAVKQNMKALLFASHDIISTKEVQDVVTYHNWMARVKKDWQNLKTAPAKLHADKEIVIEALQQSGLALYYASESIKNEPEVVYQYWLSAVKRKGCNLKRVPEELRSDKEIIMAAVSQDPCALQFVSKDLQNDAEMQGSLYKFWLSMIETDGTNLKDAPIEFRSNKNIILLAAKNNIQAMEFALFEEEGDVEMNDIDMIYLACRYWIPSIAQDWRVLVRAPRFLQANTICVLIAVRQNWQAMDFAVSSEELRNDKEIKKVEYVHWLSEVKADGLNLRLAPKHLHSDKTIVLSAVKCSACVMYDCPEFLQNDKEIVQEYWLSMVRENCINLPEDAEELCANKGIVLEVVLKDKRAFKFVSGDIEADVLHEYWLSRAKADGMNIRDAPLNLRSDKTVIISAVRQNFSAICYAHSDLQYDDDVLYCYWLSRVKVNGMNLDEAPDKFRADVSIVCAAISQDVRALEFAHDDVKTDAKVKDAQCDYWLSKVKDDAMNLRDVPNDFRARKIISLSAIQQNVGATEFVPGELYGDSEILQIASKYWQFKVKTNWEFLRDAPSEIRSQTEVVLAAIQEDFRAFSYASEEAQGREEVKFQYWLSRVQEKGTDLKDAPDEVKANIDIVAAAVQQDMSALDFASNHIKTSKVMQGILFEGGAYGFWLAKVKADGMILRDAPEMFRRDRLMVIAAVQQHGGALKFASEELQSDLELNDISHDYWWSKMMEYGIHMLNEETTSDLLSVLQEGETQIQDVAFAHWLSKVKEDGANLRFAPMRYRADRIVVTEAVQHNSWDSPLRYASEAMQNDKAIAMTAIQHDGSAFKYSSVRLQNDKDVLHCYWLTKAKHNGLCLRYAPSEIRSDKKIVLAAVHQDGEALKFAAVEFTRDKDVVLEAVKHDPNATKYVHEDLKRDPDILVAAGMFDSNHESLRPRNLKKIAFSTRFSLSPSSRSEATNFTKLFKDHHYIQRFHFKVYAPNAFDKQSCDPDWTNFDHPCRGTKDTCHFDFSLKSGHPTDDCCWRYSFRHQLIEAKKSGGFMLQLIEKGEDDNQPPTLGNGQRIEQDMARELNLKVFHVYRPMPEKGYGWKFEMHHMDEVVANIERWYDDGCQEMAESTVRPTSGIGLYAMGTSGRMFS